MNFKLILKSLPQKLAKLKKIQPVFSLLWGIGAGFLMVRNFQVSWRLLAFCVLVALLPLLVYASIYGILLFAYLKEKEPALAFKKAKPLVDFGRNFLLQCAFQYVYMFSLPFFWKKQSLSLFLCGTFIAIPAFWDPWWNTLIKTKNYNLLVRIWIFLVITLICIPIFLPQYMTSFYIFVFLSGFIVLISTKGRNIKKVYAIVLWSLVWLLATYHPKWHFFPVLSVWLHNESFSPAIENKNPIRRIPNSINQEEFAHFKTLCCYTPLIAPYGLRSSITHRWFIDGKLARVIPLKPISGYNENNAWRTWSCKKVFTSGIPTSTITCEVYLENTVYVGKISLKILPTTKEKSLRE